MIINQLVFPIKANDKFVEGGIDTFKLTANSKNRDIIYVISPKPLSASVVVNFSNQYDGKKNASATLYPSDIKIEELVNVEASFYELIKEWNVWQGVIPSKALELISSNVAGSISLSFTITQRITPAVPHGVEFKGNILEPTDIVGDGAYRVDNIGFTYEAYELDYGDLLIINGETTVVKKAVKQSVTTSSLTYSVDPSVKIGEFEVIDFSLIETLTNLVGSVKEDYHSLNVATDEHVNNKNNPHSVTAEQVGTYTTAEIDAKLDTNGGGSGGNSNEPDGVTIVLNEDDKLEVNLKHIMDGGYL